jgi:outer membrane immunogenic protein
MPIPNGGFFFTVAGRQQLGRGGKCIISTISEALMKYTAIAIAVIAALIGTPALAADMAMKAPPPPAPTYNWTGFYIGGNAGYGWNDPTVTFTPNDIASQTFICDSFGLPTCPPVSFSSHGALGGLQAGYNWQLDQSWLTGVETDFQWSNVEGTGASSFIIPFLPPILSPASFAASENVRWFGTLRARVGYLPTNRLLLYATGGFAYGRVDENVALNAAITGASFNTFSFLCSGFAGTGANCFVGNSSRTAAGFTVGAGGEYALWNNISLKVEYLYVNLGRGKPVDVVAQAVSTAGNTPSSFTAVYSTVEFNVVRGGLNWKF